MNELAKLQDKSLTDWKKFDAAALTEEEDFVPDWTKAELVIPQARQSVHLRLEKDIIDFFRSTGKGHISRMQAVLKSYVEAHS